MDHVSGPFAIEKMGRCNDNIGKKRRAMKKVKRELKKICDSGMDGTSGKYRSKETIHARRIAKRIAIVRERRYNKTLLEMELIDYISIS